MFSKFLHSLLILIFYSGLNSFFFLMWQLNRGWLNRCNLIKSWNRSCSCSVVSGCFQKHISEVASYIRQERILRMPIYRQLLKDISGSQDHACLTCITLALNVNKSKLGSVHNLIHLGHILWMSSRGRGYFSPLSVSEWQISMTPHAIFLQGVPRSRNVQTYYESWHL